MIKLLPYLHTKNNKRKLKEISSITNNLIRIDDVTWLDAVTHIKRTVPKTKEYTHVPVSMDSVKTLSYRCKGDLAIRRLRAKDILRTVSSVTRHAMGYLTHLDTILFTNIMVWTSIFGVECLNDLLTTGIFEDFETFRSAASKISTWIKRFPYCNDNTKQALGELNCLTGYLQTNPEGFNLEEEFDKLINAGNPHGLIGDNWNDTYLNKLKNIMTRESFPPFMTLDEYIFSGKWITAGSSSIGKVEWKYADEKGKFKARKNMLTQLYTSEELLALAVNWDGTIQNKVFTKDELGKRRLAVASNIESYLVESYLSYLGGHGFKNWKYMTLDETPAAQHNRMDKVADLLKTGSFALPWDYAQFDHQVLTSEVQMIVKQSGVHVRENIPTYYKQTYDELLAKSVNSYNNNYLTMTVDNKELNARQKGGLPSGIRRTSYIGNVDNAVKTDINRDITKIITVTDDIEVIRLKGDDTYIISKDPVSLYVFRAVYAAMNVIGLDSKFGISPNICEFLRVEMRPNACQGWTCRAIPSITQRKPWNAQPWSPSAEVTTVANNIYLTERRCNMQLTRLHNANKIKWSKFTSQSQRWLELPKHMGGFGIYDFNGWVPNSKLPLVSKPLINIENKIQDTVVSWIALTPQTQQAYNNEIFNDKLASDDIAGPQKFYSKQFINEFRSRKYEWEKQQFIIPSVRTVPGPGTDAKWPWFPFVDTSANTCTFPTFQQFVREHQALKRATERIDAKIPSLMDYTERYYPGIFEKVKYLEKNGWHRTDAINIAVGDYPTEPLKILHPILSPFVKKSIDINKPLYWKGRTNIAIRLYMITSTSVQHINNTSGHMYMW